MCGDLNGELCSGLKGRTKGKAMDTGGSRLIVVCIKLDGMTLHLHL